MAMGDTRKPAKLEEGRRREGRRESARKQCVRVVGWKQSRPSNTENRRAPCPGSGVMGAPPVLLTGGNPRIAKGEGNRPVQRAYIAGHAGWKRDHGRRLDALIEPLPFRRAQR